MYVSEGWLWVSGIFFAVGTLSTLVMTIMLVMLIMRVKALVDSLQPTLTNVATKIGDVSTTVQGLTHKVEGITEKVEGIADSVKGIAESAKGVADSARSTVQNVGSRAAGVVDNVAHSAEDTIRNAQGNKYFNYLMMGIQILNALRLMKEGKDAGSKVKVKAHVDMDGQLEGKMPVDRGVEQSGSSSGS
jgi:uncharacterized protein YoxC